MRNFNKEKDCIYCGTSVCRSVKIKKNIPDTGNIYRDIEVIQSMQEIRRKNDICLSRG